jgi:aspartate/methionine/tyrosine aminotransferase
MRHSTRSEVDPFIVMDVMEAARAAEEAGRDIVHMEVGQPGSGAPRAARDRLRHEMEGGPLGYTVALGRPICALPSQSFTASGTMWTSTPRAWC